MNDGHDEIDTQVAHLRMDMDDLKERVTNLETLTVDKLRGRVERLTNAMRTVIDDGLYQPQSADVLEEALKEE